MLCNLRQNQKFHYKKNSIFFRRSEQQDIVVPVPKYMISTTVPEHDSTSRRIISKGMQDIRMVNPGNADPFYRPQFKPTEIPTQAIPRENTRFQTLTYWNRTLTQILKKKSHIKKV